MEEKYTKFRLNILEVFLIRSANKTYWQDSSYKFVNTDSQQASLAGARPAVNKSKSCKDDSSPTNSYFKINVDIKTW